jgi:Diacylglycerol kinase catalytic domain
MKRTLLIINKSSGSVGAVDYEELKLSFGAAGFAIEHIVELPEDELPERDDVEAMAVDVVATLSGDGTVAGVCEKLNGWSGALLVLPGGTMNLLSRRLYGEQTVGSLLEMLQNGEYSAERVSVVQTPVAEVFTGLIAGPSTRWGEVRESIRNLDLAEVVEKVPEAWAATTTSDSVRIESIKGGYPAIFVEPLDNGNLGIRAFRADGVGDMLSHGIAWLRRDFRDGPHDELGELRAVNIIDDSDAVIGLLLDGEQSTGKSPFQCVAGQSTLKFILVRDPKGQGGAVSRQQG